MLPMTNKKTIGMLVLAVSAVMTAAALVLPSMTMVAQAEQCASSASSVEGSALSASSTESNTVDLQKDCATFAQATPPEP
jgi:hypothetical protein